MPWEAAKAHAGFTSAEKSWLPVPYEQAALSVDAQQADGNSVLTHYRQTLEFRKQHPALIDGDMAFIGTNQDLLAFTRQKGEERLLFVFNLTREAVEFELPAGFEKALPLEIPGFVSRIEKGVVMLDWLDGFCGRV